jgi:hypothetical protein
MYNHVFVSDPAPPSPEFGVQPRPCRTRNGHVAAMTPQPDEFVALCRGSVGRTWPATRASRTSTLC